MEISRVYTCKFSEPFESIFNPSVYEYGFRVCKKNLVEGSLIYKECEDCEKYKEREFMNELWS